MSGTGGVRVVLAETSGGCVVTETVFPDGAHVYGFYRGDGRVAEATTLRALSEALDARKDMTTHPAGDVIAPLAG